MECVYMIFVVTTSTCTASCKTSSLSSRSGTRNRRAYRLSTKLVEYNYKTVLLQLEFLIIIAQRPTADTLQKIDPASPATINLHAEAVDVANAIDNLRRAAVPVSLGSSVAIGISEGVAGAIGALASRKTADAIGDKKLDSLLTKITATGAFFGSRGIIIAASRILGLPRPLSLPVASVVASIISESTKAAGRYSQPLEPGQKAEPFSERLDAGEIIGDITKWLVFDFLDDRRLLFQNVDQDLDHIIASATYGALSALAGALTRDLVLGLEKHLPASKSKPDVFIKSYYQSALEGAVLFGCYQSIVSALQFVAPQSLGIKFIFNNLLEDLEESLENFEE
eukprot:gene24225-29295_t